MFDEQRKKNSVYLAGIYGTARYDRALTLKIIFEQTNMIKLNLSNFLQSNYNLINDNCAHIWNVALKTINYNFKGNGFGHNVKFKALKFFYFPSIKFETRQSDKW